MSWVRSLIVLLWCFVLLSAYTLFAFKYPVVSIALKGKLPVICLCLINVSVFEVRFLFV